jgi:hypothetical protein
LLRIVSGKGAASSNAGLGEAAMHDRRPAAGVRIFDDHRDNLTVDVHNDLVRARAADLRSEHSDAALLWNVFRTLERIDIRTWLPRLLRQALPDAARSGAGPRWAAPEELAQARFHWWRRWDLPPERHALLRDAAQCGTLCLDHYPAQAIPEKRSEVERRLAAGLPFEEPVEVPLCIETPAFVVGVEAVYRSNLRRHTTFDGRRDAVARMVDAGTWAAGARPFIALVVHTDGRVVNLETARLIERYRGQPERLLEALPHRDDRAALASAASRIGTLRWRDIGTLLLAIKDEERLGAFDIAALDELVKYLARKDVGFSFFRRLK